MNNSVVFRNPLRSDFVVCGGILFPFPDTDAIAILLLSQPCVCFGVLLLTYANAATSLLMSVTDSCCFLVSYLPEREA